MEVGVLDFDVPRVPAFWKGNGSEGPRVDSENTPIIPERGVIDTVALTQELTGWFVHLTGSIWRILTWQDERTTARVLAGLTLVAVIVLWMDLGLTPLTQVTGFLLPVPELSMGLLIFLILPILTNFPPLRANLLDLIIRSSGESPDQDPVPLSTAERDLQQHAPLDPIAASGIDEKQLEKEGVTATKADVIVEGQETELTSNEFGVSTGTVTPRMFGLPESERLIEVAEVYRIIASPPPQTSIPSDSPLTPIATESVSGMLALSSLWIAFLPDNVRDVLKKQKTLDSASSCAARPVNAPGDGETVDVEARDGRLRVPLGMVRGVEEMTIKAFPLSMSALEIACEDVVGTRTVEKYAFGGFESPAGLARFHTSLSAHLNRMGLDVSLNNIQDPPVRLPLTDSAISLRGNESSPMPTSDELSSRSVPPTPSSASLWSTRSNESCDKLNAPVKSSEEAQMPRSDHEQNRRLPISTTGSHRGVASTPDLLAPTRRFVLTTPNILGSGPFRHTEYLLVEPGRTTATTVPNATMAAPLSHAQSSPFPRPIITTGVRRRYSEFVDLHHAISGIRIGACRDVLVVPPLPPKRRVERFDANFVLKRQRELENWLNRIAEDDVVRDTKEFRRFVGWEG
ncbi:hypothetical protein HDU93_005550 [Gonapodya sp. JEL0774]|nr:hypothetical protein HDU93_005550 [Gonapodya sp. JEL0774]